MMLKHEARKAVQDRASLRYPKSVVTLLAKIVDLTHVGNWQTDQIEHFASTPRTQTKLGFLTNLSERSVRKALKVLQRDAVIKSNPRQKGSYVLNPEVLLLFASKYLASQPRIVERKILRAVRMRFFRVPNRKVQPFAENHAVCTCVPPFCSHPSV